MINNANTARQRFWASWLVWTGWLFCATGLSFVLLREFTAQVFALILYADSQVLLKLEPPVLRYVFLVHAILGAVIATFGYSIVQFAKQIRGDAPLPYLSLWGVLLVWFVPDTSYSLLSGFWQNAIFNLAFALPVLVGLMGLSASARHDSKGR
jgi:hypothetical protein